MNPVTIMTGWYIGVKFTKHTLPEYALAVLIHNRRVALRAGLRDHRVL